MKQAVRASVGGEIGEICGNVHRLNYIIKVHLCSCLSSCAQKPGTLGIGVN